MNDATRLHLRSAFRNEVNRSKANGNGPFIFLELFGGSGRFTSAVRRLGFGCISFELRCHEHFNLLNPVVSNIIIGWIRSNCIAGIMLSKQLWTSLAQVFPQKLAFDFAREFIDALYLQLSAK